MSEVSLDDRIHNGLADWIAQASDPTIAPPSVPPLASYLLRQSGAVHEIYLRTETAGSDAAGWTRQNLTQLGVFNVKAFGALGNNTADDSAAINAAINAAVARGGGTVYFPPGQYAIFKPAGSINFDLNAATFHDLLFLGDGQSSQIRMKGSAGLGAWTMFRIVNGAQRIAFQDLFFDAAQTTQPDAAEQQHTILVAGRATDGAGTGGKDVDIVGCYFGSQVGDGVRQLAEAGREVSNVRVITCDIGMINARACYSIQRFTGDGELHYCFLQETTDQEIDFEPTASGSVGRFSIIGNIINHQPVNGTFAFTYTGSGVGSEAFNSTIAFNVIPGGGGGFEFSNTIGVAIVGNIFTKNALSSSNTAFVGQSENQNAVIAGNVITHDTNAVALAAFNAQNTIGQPAQFQIVDNCIRSTFGDLALLISGGTFINVEGNICSLLADGTGVETVCSIEGLIAKTNPQFVGNIATGDNVKYLYKIGAGNGNAILNPMMAANLGHSLAGSFGFIFDLGTYSNWTYCGENLMIGGTINPSFQLPAGSVGATLAGFAGPGPQQDIIDIVAGPSGNVKAPVGSLCVNPGSTGVGATLFYKESGVGVSGGTAGWIADGPSELVWGVVDTTTLTTACFMAPGSDLAAASATEITLAFPIAKTVRNLRMHQTAGTGGSTITYTLRKNNANTAMAITVNVTVATGGPAGVQSFAAGDLMSLQITKGAIPTTAPTNACVSVEVVG